MSPAWVFIGWHFDIFFYYKIRSQETAAIIWTDSRHMFAVSMNEVIPSIQLITATSLSAFTVACHGWKLTASRHKHAPKVRHQLKILQALTGTENDFATTCGA